jgi:integrase
MKHPNGFGTVVKLSGNRRNPFVARKTKGWNDKGHPVFDVIGYFPTRETALIALGKYNASPWDVQSENTTLADLYRLWNEKKAHKLGASSLCTLKTGYNHCSKIYNMRYKDIKAYHMQEVIDKCGCGYATQAQIKNLFYHLDRFALETDLITRRYSELITVAPVTDSDKTPFTPDEIGALWANASAPWADTALIFLYSGWRISELLALRRDDVDLAAGTMRGGVKTRAGRGRIVPIHSKIYPFVKERYDFGGDYLIGDSRNKGIAGVTYRLHWRRLMRTLNVSHTPHETRHTFRSCLDSAGANKVCIDLLMGHKSKDVGERVYTHKTLKELKNTVELVTY